MRIGSRGYADVIKANIARPSARLTDLYGQLSSSKRLSKLSDDPVAAPRAVRGHNALAELASRKLVIAQGTQMLGAADTALGTISNALSRVQALCLEAVNPSANQAGRTAISQEIRDLSASLVTAGNASIDGQYVFSGTKTDTGPLVETPTGNLPVAYQGNQQPLEYAVTPSETVPASVTGAQVFNYPDDTGARPVAGVDADTFSLLKDIADSIDRGDTNRVSELTKQVQATYDNVVGLRGRVGALVQRYQHASQTVEDTDLQVRNLLSNDEDVDYASAIVDLQQQETTYQAVMATTSRMLQLPNLFDTSW
jgi:flagellar hook-associated protein 3 FlgL